MVGLTDLRLLQALREDADSVQAICNRTAQTGPALDWFVADEALEVLAHLGLSAHVGGRFAATALGQQVMAAMTEQLRQVAA